MEIDNSHAHILRLNIAGHPIEWLTWQEATTLYARDLVTWTLGDTILTVRGGISRITGERSSISLHSIVACAGELHNGQPKKPALRNRILFRRDQNLCMYCGKEFQDKDLSCDHILPTSRGGANTWVNVVAACRRCNHHKQDRTPEEAHMELLALPYEPNPAEYLALVNSKRIRADQMEFLKSQFSKNCRLQ
ncbi:MAG: HNH endonuclease [Gammaproteobacteria bacterium]|jgi:5-methylcytosine-specific restriction endonuclease McrA|nr:HNH endonuclease [Gammaproteobacteria bacterium]